MSRVAVTVLVSDLPDGVADDVAAAVEAAMDTLEVAPQAGLALVLSTDDELHRLNREHRGLDKPTDVLSFPFDAGHVPEEEAGSYLGDILISVEYAGRSSAAEGRSLESELRLLAVHGLLHLLGHEDDTDEGAERMRQTEIALGVREE